MKKLISDELYINGFISDSLNIVAILAIISGVFVIVSKNPVVSVLFLIGLFLNTSAYLMILGINFIGLSYLLVYVGAVTILFLFILMLINIRISEIVNTTNNSVPLAIIVSILFFSSIYNAIPTTKESYISIKDINDSYKSNLLHNNVQYNDISYNTSLNGIYDNYLQKNTEGIPLKDVTKYASQGIDIKDQYQNFSSNESDYKFTDISVIPDFKTIDLNIFPKGRNVYLNITEALKPKLLPFSDQFDESLTFLTYTQIWDCMLAETSHINILGNTLYTSYPIWLIITSIILLLAMVGAIVITLKN